MIFAAKAALAVAGALLISHGAKKDKRIPTPPKVGKTTASVRNIGSTAQPMTVAKLPPAFYLGGGTVSVTRSGEGGNDPTRGNAPAGASTLATGSLMGFADAAIAVGRGVLGIATAGRSEMVFGIADKASTAYAKGQATEALTEVADTPASMSGKESSGQFAPQSASATPDGANTAGEVAGLFGGTNSADIGGSGGGVGGGSVSPDGTGDGTGASSNE